MKSILMMTLLFTSWSLRAQETNYGDISQGIDSVFSNQEAQGMQFVMVNRDSVLLNRNYGINPKTTQPVTDQTSYLLNAITEPFTAIALLHLLESKQLSIEAELKEIAPEVPFKNEWKNEYPIKIRHLIAHTTGWQKGHFHHFLLDRNKLSLKEIVLNYPESRISQYPPGQCYSHSNDGYSMAGYLIEQLSGMSYEAYVIKHLLEPLGMVSSSFNSEAPTLATQANSPSPYPMMTDRPSDGLVSNATDMANFLQLLLNDDRKDRLTLIDSSIISQVKSSANTLYDQASGTVAQGYGFYKMKYRDTEVIMVKGADIQFAAQLILIPKYGIGVFFALTGGESDRIAIRNYLLSQLIPSQEVECEKAPASEEWIGYYQSIGYSYKLERFINDLFGIASIEAIDGNLYYRNLFETPQPMFKSGKSNLLTTNNQFTTQYALVQDAENNTVLTNSDGEQFKKTSGAWVWTRLIFAFASILGLLSLPVVGFIRILVRLISKRPIAKNKSLQLFLWSLLPLVIIIITTISLVPQEPMQALQSMQRFASVSIQSILLFVATLGFGAVGVFAVASTIRNLKSVNSLLLKGFLVFLATVFSIAIYYLASYGMIGLRGWVM